jgi:hypothetical protein
MAPHFRRAYRHFDRIQRQSLSLFVREKPDLLLRLFELFCLRALETHTEGRARQAGMPPPWLSKAVCVMTFPYRQSFSTILISWSARKTVRYVFRQSFQ